MKVTLQKHSAPTPKKGGDEGSEKRELRMKEGKGRSEPISGIQSPKVHLGRWSFLWVHHYWWTLAAYPFRLPLGAQERATLFLAIAP